jgi:hypothetical protein
MRSLYTLLESTGELKRGLLISEVKDYVSCAYRPLFRALIHYLLNRDIHDNSLNEWKRTSNFKQKKDQPFSWSCHKGMSSTQFVSDRSHIIAVEYCTQMTAAHGA